MVGCSLTDQRVEAWQATDPASARIIALDFSGAIKQIATLEPATTTLQFERSSDLDNPFISSLREALAAAGYGIQLVEEPAGEHLVRHRASRAVFSSSGPADIYEVSIGKVRLRREYRLDEKGYVEPASALLVKGADVSSITARDSVFRRPYTGQPTAPVDASPAASPVTSDRPSTD